MCNFNVNKAQCLAEWFGVFCFSNIYDELKNVKSIFSKKLFLMNMYNLHVKLWILKNKQFKSEVTPLIIWSAWGHGLSLLFYDKYLSVPKNIMWLSKSLKCAKTMFDILKKRKGNSNQMNSNCHQYTCMITKYNNKNNVQTYYM